MDAEKYHKSAVTAEEIHSTTEPYTSITARLDKTKQNNTKQHNSQPLCWLFLLLFKFTKKNYTHLYFTKLWPAHLFLCCALHSGKSTNSETQKLRNSETNETTEIIEKPTTTWGLTSSTWCDAAAQPEWNKARQIAHSHSQKVSSGKMRREKKKKNQEKKTRQKKKKYTHTHTKIVATSCNYHIALYCEVVATLVGAVCSTHCLGQAADCSLREHLVGKQKKTITINKPFSSLVNQNIDHLNPQNSL